MIDPQAVFRDLYRKEAIEAGPPYFTVWTVSGDLPYFEGHFPGLPIFPGLGIVDATLHFLKGVLKKSDLPMPTVTKAKFINPIVPGQTVRLELTPVSAREWQAEWKEEGASKLLATLHLCLKN